MKTRVFFVNNYEDKHERIIVEKLKTADKVYFAVGFLKGRGLDRVFDIVTQFCSDPVKASRFFIGTGFGETDGEALKKLYMIVRRYKDHKLFLCTPDAGIFHPKVFLFVSGENATIITGSANWTYHGLNINDEMSMVYETTTDTPVFLQIMNYFEALEAKYPDCDIKSEIIRYSKEQKQFSAANKKTPRFNFRKNSSTDEIDFKKLEQYFSQYEKSTEYVVPETREKQYLVARKNLDILASNQTLSDIEFHELFGPLVGHKDYKPKLWHSGSIHRATYKTLNYADSFRDLVRAVKANIINPVDVAYDNIIGLLMNMKKSKTISGIGANVITEMLLSFNPKKFANLNENPISVLTYIGKEYPMSYFKGADYKEYVNLLDDIRKKLHMKSLLEIDSFFNFVYWNFLEEN